MPITQSPGGSTAPLKGGTTSKIGAQADFAVSNLQATTITKITTAANPSTPAAERSRLLREVSAETQDAIRLHNAIAENNRYRAVLAKIANSWQPLGGRADLEVNRMRDLANRAIGGR